MRRGCVTALLKILPLPCARTRSTLLTGPCLRPGPGGRPGLILRPFSPRTSQPDRISFSSLNGPSSLASQSLHMPFPLPGTLGPANSYPASGLGWAITSTRKSFGVCPTPSLELSAAPTIRCPHNALPSRHPGAQHTAACRLAGLVLSYWVIDSLRAGARAGAKAALDRQLSNERINAWLTTLYFPKTTL